eukprot:6154970-Pleurochrysis_carterae.AAC.1
MAYAWRPMSSYRRFSFRTWPPFHPAARACGKKSVACTPRTGTQFGAAPFRPLYCNGQGATPRKLKPHRWCRTTEGGGPRRLTLDAAGLAAWSINGASKAHHTPQYFRHDTRL